MIRIGGASRHHPYRGQSWREMWAGLDQEQRGRVVGVLFMVVCLMCSTMGAARGIALLWAPAGYGVFFVLGPVLLALAVLPYGYRKTQAALEFEAGLVDSERFAERVAAWRIRRNARALLRTLPPGFPVSASSRRL